jgi:type II secretory pathway component HofQ
MRTRRDPVEHYGETAANFTTGPEIDINFEDVELRDALAEIASKANTTLLLDEDVRERVTISLGKIPWRDAVEVIAKMAKCELAEVSPGVFRLGHP